MDHPSLTLMEALKDAVSERHSRMEALPFITAMTHGELPLESYVGQLRAMAVIQGTLDHELSMLNVDNIRTLVLDRPSRLVHLRKDLSLLDKMLIPDIKAALPHIRRIASLIRLFRIGQPTDLLGIIYVLEGTTLGNALHLPDVIKTFGSQTNGTAHYYAGFGNGTAKNWQRFYSAMNAIPLDQESRQRIVQVALSLFDHLEDLYSALYPIQDAELIFTANMLNPEAGDHPIPQDAREIEAAITAGNRCRCDFPYIDERFGERGRGFTKSDAAWLATLAELPETELQSQVEWLGRVLGNRGMPRIILERQLELLHAELVANVPEKANKFEGLLEAANNLREERFQRIPEPTFDEIIRSFNFATNGEMQGRFIGTGALIVSAVCDQDAGISEAINGLLPWLTDTERFAPSWSVEVTRVCQLAQDSLASGSLGAKQ